MRNPREILLWLVAGLAGVLLLVAFFPLAFPLAPWDWRISSEEATVLAVERLRDLGEVTPGAYTVTHLNTDLLLERRLLRERARWPANEAPAALSGGLLQWEVFIYPPGALARDWSHRARIAFNGEIRSLRRSLASQETGAPIAVGAARSRADAFLREQGLDPEGFGEPQQLAQQLQGRTDLNLRYPVLNPVLGEELPYGYQVIFAGEALVGYSFWFDDPAPQSLRQEVQPVGFLNTAHTLVVLLILPVVAFFFVRRYHEGEVGVRTGLVIFGVTMALGTLFLLLVAPSVAQSFDLGIFSRLQTTWLWGFQMLGFSIFPFALLCFLSWSVGESFCRERWGAKLASFDALFRARWNNATLARSALRGLTGGLFLAGAVVALAVPLSRLGVWTPVTSLFFWPSHSHWFGVAMTAYGVVLALYQTLFGRLFLLPPVVRRLGVWPGGIAVALVTGVAFIPTFWLLPLGAGLLLWAAVCGALVFLFLRYDLLTSLLACFVALVAVPAFPYLMADDAWLQLQGVIPFLAAAFPLLVSVRYLASDRELTYRFDDMPPHVRRIADRERQRVELETARGIQSAILPILPEQLAGVELAHAYMPAREVGGDFYDVLALEDGRLAVAVGDVAGHGVSSGLIMSMAKSALAVQVTFDPRVEAVFNTLNRMVHQSARKRLLSTLCYLLLDPPKRHLVYGSAGHLFPYCISAGGAVRMLESVAYPLGVRPTLRVPVRETELQPGDTLLLLSDGLVEARAEGSDEVYGFRRLEESLAKHIALPLAAFRDAILADMTRFAAGAPQSDDCTVLALRLP